MDNENGVLIERQEIIRIEGKKIGNKTTVLVFHLESPSDMEGLLGIARRINERTQELEAHHFTLVAPQVNHDLLRKVLALIQAQRFRSGCITWFFKEKIDPDWCAKCQEFGHPAANRQ